MNVYIDTKNRPMRLVGGRAEAIDWARAIDWVRGHRRHGRAVAERLTRILRSIDDMDVERAIIRPLNGWMHLTVIAENVIITCDLERRGSLKGWRSDGTMPIGLPLYVIIPRFSEWSIGWKARLMMSPMPGLVSVIPSDPGIRAIDVYITERMGWRDATDRTMFPGRTMAQTAGAEGPLVLAGGAYPEGEPIRWAGDGS